MDHEPNAKFPAELAVCPHQSACPGCPLIELSYADQLAHKATLVRDELAPYAELRSLSVAATEAAPSTLHYRTRAKLVASGPALGLYARGTHDLLDLPHCQVLDAELAEVVGALRALLPKEPLLAGVDVARAGSQLLVTLIARDESPQGVLARLAEQLVARCPRVAGVSMTRRASDAVQLLTGGHTRLLGAEELRAQSVAEGPYHYLSHGAFVQAHEGTARRIYAEIERRVFAEAGARPRVLELYAGSGSLALELAARGAQISAVESFGPACERLRRAAREQDLSLRVHEGDAGEQLRLLREQGAQFDVVLVNPPRRGLALEVRRQIAALAPRLLGYVSCRPSTLARDLAHFARLSLLAQSAQPFDMMPQTDQVETLVWLTPGSAAPTPSFETSAGLVLEKPPFTSMEELTREARAHDGFGSAVALVTLSTPVSGQVYFVATEQAAAEAATATESSRMHAFTVLAKGVLRSRGKIRVGSSQVRYERERVIAGHSLLQIEAPDESSVRAALIAIAHPLIGDARADREGARFFTQRHGLDRPFLHLARCAGVSAEHETPLAPDLLAVLRSLSDRSARAGLGAL